MQTPVPQTYEAGVAPEQRQLLERTRELSGAMLGITHALNPVELTEQNLFRLFQSGRLIAGWIGLHSTTKT